MKLLFDYLNYFFLDKGQVFGWGNTEYGQMTLPGGDQQVASPHYIKMLSNLGRIKCIATAGAFCLVLNGRETVVDI